MSLEGLSLNEVTEQHLTALVGKLEEGLCDEFKVELKIGADDEKQEFLRDVSAFANSAGGHLFIGMTEAGGVLSGLPGISVKSAEQTELRIQDVIQTGLEPSIPGLEVRAVPLSNGNVVPVIRIPQSWRSPHRVKYGSRRQFFGRAGKKKYEMEIDVLRAAFVLSETLADRIRDFRAARIARIVAGDEVPVRLADGPKIILHLVPFGAFRPGVRCDLEELRDLLDRRGLRLQTLGGRAINARRNLDGRLTFESIRDGGTGGYCQVFRNGSIEVVDARLIGDGPIPADQIGKALAERSVSYVQAQQKIGAQPPIMAMLTITGVRGRGVGKMHYRELEDLGEPIDRDHLIIPEEMVKSFESDVTAVLQELMKMVWEAANYPV